MIELKLGIIGRHITQVIAEAIPQAPVFFIFNDIRVEIPNKNVSADDIFNKWQSDFDIKAQAYKNSPEYAREAKKSQKEIARLNLLLKKGIDDLDTLNYSSIHDCLEFFCNMQNATEDNRVHFTLLSEFKAKCLSSFTKNGYKIGAYTEDQGKFDYTDPDILGRYIIGQVLSTLNLYGIHGIIEKFTCDYLKCLADKS